MAQSSVLQIGELESTLNDEQTLLPAFRQFLRGVDGKSKASPEIKGRFERCLDFLIAMNEIYALPQSQMTEIINQLKSIRKEYFVCPPMNRLSVSSQLALKSMSQFLTEINEKSLTKIEDLSKTREVFQDVYRKVQQKHDVFKKNYKPSITLNTIMCLLS